MSVHPTAIVSTDAPLGSNVSIGPYAIIERELKIGDNCDIRAPAVIKRFTTLASNNYVYEGAVLGGEPQDLSYRDCKSYLYIGSDNHIREGATIHRGTQPESATTVGSG